MGRIRTIKPEFPQSESVGKLSRDARLLFIQLWTLVDDAGRCRAAPRMLAGQLYPYDDDAAGLIETWLGELEAGDHVRRYTANGSTYLEVVKWQEHQKIDRPSKSRLPNPPEVSTSPREPSWNTRRSLEEPSTTDLGPGTKDQGPRTEDHGPTTGDQAGGVLEPAKPKSLISEAAHSLARDVSAAMGLEPHDPRVVGAPFQMQSWLNAGWNAEVILEGVKRGMHSRKGDPPSTLRYFERAIARAHAEFTAGVPTVVLKSQEITHVVQANQLAKPESLGAVANRLADAGISFGPRPTGIPNPKGRPAA
jgi:hypothetical protein